MNDYQQQRLHKLQQLTDMNNVFEEFQNTQQTNTVEDNKEQSFQTLENIMEERMNTPTENKINVDGLLVDDKKLNTIISMYLSNDNDIDSIIIERVRHNIEQIVNKQVDKYMSEINNILDI